MIPLQAFCHEKCKNLGGVNFTWLHGLPDIWTDYFPYLIHVPRLGEYRGQLGAAENQPVLLLPDLRSCHRLIVSLVILS